MWDHVTTEGVQAMAARDHRLVKRGPLDYATIEQIRALYAAGHTRQAIATTLGLSWSTVDKYLKLQDQDALEQLRDQKKRGFIDNAWASIQMGSELIKQQIERLLRESEGLSAKEIQHLTTSLGILYDKQALAQGDPTQIAHGVVAWQDIACGQDRDQDPGVDPASELVSLDE